MTTYSRRHSESPLSFTWIPNHECLCLCFDLQGDSKLLPVYIWDYRENGSSLYTWVRKQTLSPLYRCYRSDPSRRSEMEPRALPYRFIIMRKTEALEMHIGTSWLLLIEMNDCTIEKPNCLNPATMSQSVSIQESAHFLKPLGHIHVHKR